MGLCFDFFFFFFNDTATTEIYTLSLHDALPTSGASASTARYGCQRCVPSRSTPGSRISCRPRSEEHTSELQSLAYLVCRLLLEKKKNKVRRIDWMRKRRNTQNQ